MSGSPSAPVLLRDHTTFRLGGPAGSFVVARTSDAVIDAVRAADQQRIPLLVLGGGSNLLVADQGFPGQVVFVATTGWEVVSQDDCAGVQVRVAAGTPWDEFVAESVRQGWTGVEALSGIPGSVGATPLQNVGAYGQEVAQTIASVRTWDRQDQRVRTLSVSECEFGYRTSRLKQERVGQGSRYVVLEVVFQLKPGTLSAPVQYAELARALGVQVGDRAPLAQVREQVIALRQGKGMVASPDDHDSWSAGSFFTNPILSPEQATALPHGAPAWPSPDGTVKASAAWLIEHSGFAKGYGLPGPAALSSKHTLALTNRGAATTEDVLALARTIRNGVREAFGVELVPEPMLIGCSLD